MRINKMVMNLAMFGSNNTQNDDIAFKSESMNIFRCEFSDSDAKQPDIFFDSIYISIENDVIVWFGNVNNVNKPFYESLNLYEDFQFEYDNSEDLLSVDGS